MQNSLSLLLVLFSRISKVHGFGFWSHCIRDVRSFSYFPTALCLSQTWGSEPPTSSRLLTPWVEDSFSFVSPTPFLEFQCQNDNWFGNLGVPIQNCSARGLILSGPTQGRQLHLAPWFLKVATQKNCCSRSGSTKGEMPPTLHGRASAARLPPNLHSSREVCSSCPVGISLPTEAHQCKEMLHVAIALQSPHVSGMWES